MKKWPGVGDVMSKKRPYPFIWAGQMPELVAVNYWLEANSTRRKTWYVNIVSDTCQQAHDFCAICKRWRVIGWDLKLHKAYQ